MKKQTTISALLSLLIISVAQAAAETPTRAHTLAVTPKTKRAFQAIDAIEIRQITGAAPKFQVGGTYRVTGIRHQQTLKNTTLYLGNTPEAGAAAITTRS